MKHKENLIKIVTDVTTNLRIEFFLIPNDTIHIVSILNSDREVPGEIHLTLDVTKKLAKALSECLHDVDEVLHPTKETFRDKVIKFIQRKLK